MSVNLIKSTGNYGDVIKQSRIKVFGMNQEEFAERMNVNINTLRNWEQGLSTPPEYFMAYLRSEEALLKADYDTPLSILRREFANDHNSNPRKRMMIDNAINNISNDASQVKIAAEIKAMLKKDGMIDNLQKISDYFDSYTTTDVSAIMQMLLLKEISSKLDVIIEKLDAGKDK